MRGVSLLVAKSLPRRLRFDHGPVNAKFLADKVNRDSITSQYVDFFVRVCGSFDQRTTIILKTLSRFSDEEMGKT